MRHEQVGVGGRLKYRRHMDALHFSDRDTTRCHADHNCGRVEVETRDGTVFRASMLNTPASFDASDPLSTWSSSNIASRFRIVQNRVKNMTGSRHVVPAIHTGRQNITNT